VRRSSGYGSGARAASGRPSSTSATATCTASASSATWWRRAWYTRAAERGEGLAAYELGLIYEQGLGVKADRKAAARWFGVGAKAGHELSAAKVAEYRKAGR
jgi:hypothetical protein